MFSTWNPVAHVILLQAAFAFYYLIWPALKKGLAWVSRQLPKHWFQSEEDDDLQARARGPYRGNWRDAQYQRAHGFKREQQRTYQHRKADAGRTANPLKSQHLSVLGLHEPVDLIEVKSAYRRLAKTYHPDRFAAAKYSDAARASAAEKMRDVNAAYDWLRANA